MQALGIDSGISKSEVSRIRAKLDVEVNAFRNGSLAHIEFPYVYLDTTYVKARDTDLHQVVSRAVVIATGITAGGDGEVLGLAVGDSEAETFWTEFLRSLRRRGRDRPTSSPVPTGPHLTGARGGWKWLRSARASSSTDPSQPTTSTPSTSFTQVTRAYFGESERCRDCGPL